MKNIFWISLVIYLLTTGFACNSGKNAVRSVPDKQVKANPYENSVIVMERTPCFGKCPTFKITIKGTGAATYEGKNNVSKIGMFEKQFSVEETQKLFKAFIDGGIFDFKDEYTARVTDLPSCKIAFTHEGKTKNIHDYFEAPEKLHELEKMVDAFANSDNWTQK